MLPIADASAGKSDCLVRQARGRHKPRNVFELQVDALNLVVPFLSSLSTMRIPSLQLFDESSSRLTFDKADLFELSRDLDHGGDDRLSCCPWAVRCDPPHYDHSPSLVICTLGASMFFVVRFVQNVHASSFSVLLMSPKFVDRPCRSTLPHVFFQVVAYLRVCLEAIKLRCEVLRL